jgi:peptide/nickel transport system substrate-binding protein
MLKRKIWASLMVLTIASLALAACTPANVTPVVVTSVVTQIVEGTPVEVVKEITAVPTAVPTEPKVMVVCMAQEPQTLYTLSEAALVKSAVLEAVYDWGVDTRSYGYQAVGITEVPSFDNGLATQTEVEVKVGDTVYDAATDAVVTIEATSTVTLNQLDGSQATVDFATEATAKAIQLSVSWTLVDGTTWEDGTPVTTDDILFAWEVASSPDTPTSKYTIERTASFTAVDKQTWTWVTLPGYTSGEYFLEGVINPLPKHIYGEGGSRPLSPAEMLEDEEVNRDPLAFGPFTVEEWIAGDRITLSKNPTYYRASEGLPKLDTLVYRFVPDTNSLIAQLASGECDMGTQDAAFEGSLPLIRQFEEQGLLAPQVVAGTVFEHLDFNILPVDSYTGFANSVKNDDGSPFFANAEIRQAIAYCIDRQAVVDQTTNGAAVIQHTYTASDHPLYAGDDNITIYPFDPAKGLELLAKNGWTDSDGDGILDKGGEKLSFVHSTRTNPLRQKVTQVVQAQLKANCMIETTIELYGGEYFADGPDGLVFGRQYDMGEFAWLTGVEPPCDLYISTQIPNDVNGWGSANDTGFSNADFDAACNAATQTLNEAEKAAKHAEAQKIFTEFLPSLPLFARAKILVTGPNIEGVIMDPTANSELWNVENFDVVQN